MGLAGRTARDRASLNLPRFLPEQCLPFPRFGSRNGENPRHVLGFLDVFAKVKELTQQVHMTKD